MYSNGPKADPPSIPAEPVLPFQIFSIKKPKTIQNAEKSSSDSHLWEHVKDYVQNFSLQTTLHGFRYLGEEKRCLLERIFWLSAVLVVLTLCSLSTQSLLVSWNNKRIVLTQETTELKVWEIPFPAITICSDNQINRYALNFSAETPVSEMNDEEKDLLDLIRIICFISGRSNKTVLNETSLHYIFTKSAVPCKMSVLGARWTFDQLLPPCAYFQSVLMSQGICYTLNLVALRNLVKPEYLEVLDELQTNKLPDSMLTAGSAWESSRRGFKSNMKFIVPPWRVSGDGDGNSVSIMVNLQALDFLNFCPVSGEGLTTFFHNPSEYPSTLNPRTYLNPNRMVVVYLTAYTTSTADSLRDWRPVDRGCFFENERQLQYFKSYSQAHCDMECRSNKTLETCGGKNTPVCGPGKRDCLFTLSKRFSLFENGTAQDKKLKKTNLEECQCLPSCSEIRYDIDIVELTRNWTKFASKVDATKFFDDGLLYTPDYRRDPAKINTSLSPGESRPNIAVLNLFFKKNTVSSVMRSPMMTFSELVANIGGVMSLFIGCSIVSVFEIFYFLTLRILVNVWKQKRQKKKKKSSFFVQTPYIE
ncbi:hypothetical protein M8J75_007644 [Diaphorina citri]|nr:hypothetical protein M8J75_007644 [Diaphorina citri]